MLTVTAVSAGHSKFVYVLHLLLPSLGAQLCATPTFTRPRQYKRNNFSYFTHLEHFRSFRTLKIFERRPVQWRQYLIHLWRIQDAAEKTEMEKLNALELQPFLQLRPGCQVPPV